ncbi:hypothetical protein RIVM261_052980 [Rivularia sp. IAM M-261]|nr:hypothetical protein RIVM261_052980 [Rivularia sp. IAM M-261]
MEFQFSELQLSNLSKSDLSGANLINAYLVGANIEDCNLTASCLQFANLEVASLQRTNLISANLDGANLKKVDLTQANIYSVSFNNTDLTDAIMPDGEIYKAIKNNIILPMTRQVIRTDKAPAPVGPYNQAIVASGQMIFVAGQIAIDPRLGDVLYKDDVTKQTEQVMANLEAILTAAGATFENVVKTGVFLKDMNDFAAMNAIYAKYFPSESAPARACVEVSRLPKDVLVEIECIAVI